MPSYYEAIGEEPTYALAEGIIKAFIRELKRGNDYINEFPNASGYIEYPRESLEYRRLSRVIKVKTCIALYRLLSNTFQRYL